MSAEPDHLNEHVPSMVVHTFDSNLRSPFLVFSGHPVMLHGNNSLDLMKTVLTKSRPKTKKRDRKNKRNVSLFSSTPLSSIFTFSHLLPSLRVVLFNAFRSHESMCLPYDFLVQSINMVLINPVI